MSEFTYPGVYVKEVPSGPSAIAGVSTSNLGLVGFTTRGPVDKPTLVTSFQEFVTKFGSFTTDGLLPTMAYAFYANGGTQLFVVRVTHSDSGEAYWDWNEDATAETLGNTAEAGGLYALQLDHTPVVATVPGSVTITFQAAGGDVVFTDDGAGALTGVGGGSGLGGTGSIDYESGEVSIQLAVPGDYTGGAELIVADYTFRVLRFEMQWPGVVGNNFRVVIQPGSDDYLQASYAYWTRFTISVQEYVDGAWLTHETFSDLSLDDTTSRNYVTAVMNDTLSGSEYFTVSDYGNEMNPTALAGTLVSGESLSTFRQHSDGSSVVVPDDYDGAWKGWKYDLANAVFPTTLVAQFQFVEGNPSAPGGATALQIGIGAAPAVGVPVLTWTPAALVAGSITISCELGIIGLTTITDVPAGATGALVETTTVTQVGTVTYATGVMTIDAGLLGAPDTFVVNSPVLLDAVYAQPVTVQDDGQGNLSIVDPSTIPLTGVPEKFQLNSSGENSIDYDTGEMILTWKIDGDPAAGPCGVSTGATVATKTSTAGPWNLTSGDSFNLTVDVAAPVACAFTGTQAVHAGGIVGWPIVAPGAGDNCTVTVNGVPYTITAAGTETTQMEFLNLINAAIIGGAAVGNLTAIDIQSDIEGTDGGVAVAAGAPDLAAQIGLIAGATAGGGNVGNIHAVDASDYKTVVELATTALVTDNGDGTQTTSGVVSGSTGTLVFADVAPGTLAALGITAPLTVNGTDGFTGAETATYYTEPSSAVNGSLSGGLDGSATDSDDIVSPALAAELKGLYAFGQVDEIMQVVAADFQDDPYTIDALLTYAELMKDKFILCSVPHGVSYQDAVQWKRFVLNRYSSYGAIYYPNIKIKDPISGVNIDVPPCGHVAGVYARTDAQKNVGKAPAGIGDGNLSWCQGLEYDLTQAQVGYLYTNKINCLVQWPYTGKVVWGARSLDVAGGEWPYIQMRRLFMFVEKSVFKSTHVHVFQNNGPQLWSRISAQVNSFLSGLFTGGYLAGTSPDEAFFVICNRSNNPQSSVDQGIVYCDVGIAPNKPGEYIVFRFSQKTIS